MIEETTSVMMTKEVQALQAMMDKIIETTPDIKVFSLNKKQYADYFEQIMPHARLTMAGNPKYKGREIRKIN